MFDFNCPKCNASMTADESGAGQKTSCPECGADVVIPEETEESRRLPAGPKVRNTLGEELCGTAAALLLIGSVVAAVMYRGDGIPFVICLVVMSLLFMTAGTLFNQLGAIRRQLEDRN